MTTQMPNRSPEFTFLGLAPFLRMNLAGIDLLPISQAIYSQLEKNPEDADLFMNFSMIMQILGDPKIALSIQEIGLLLKRVYEIPAEQQPAKLRLLMLMAPGDVAENTPIDCLLEGEAIDLIFYYMTDESLFFDPIPEHDVVMVGVCESEAHRAMLDALEPAMQEWPKPVINFPQFIANTERTRASQILQDVPGLLIPPTYPIERSQLEKVAHQELSLSTCFEQCNFPLIVRPIDSHAGRNLEKITTPRELVAYLDKVADDEFFISNFIDYRDEKGNFRKLRIVLIDGQPFLAHMAISTHWMIHYVNAGMYVEAEKRAEEAEMMDHFDSFVSRHQTALQAIHQKSGMDYLGIDCAETLDGEFLVFEIDHVMVVHGMDSEELFPYKQAHIQKIRDAFVALLVNRIQQAGGHFADKES